MSDRREERHPDRDDEAALPTVPERERDDAWGDEPRERDEEWYRRERPPHHE